MVRSKSVMLTLKSVQIDLSGPWKTKSQGISFDLTANFYYDLAPANNLHICNDYIINIIFIIQIAM